MNLKPAPGAFLLRGAWMLLVVGPLVGCDPGTGTLVGTVTYQGVPLPGGIVAVVSADGKVAERKIGEDGAYSIAHAPAGVVRVTVTTQPPLVGMNSPNPMARNAPKEPGKQKEALAPLGKYVAIPKRYRDVDLSGLSCTIAKGHETKFDIPLEP